MRTDQVINKLWRGLTNWTSALLALVFLLILKLTALILPQIPVSASESAAFNRWLAELRPVLGNHTRWLAALGLLTVQSSLFLRLTLGFLALIVVANFDRLRGRSSETAEAGGAASAESTSSIHDSLSRRIGHGALVVGGLFIIIGWAGQMLWGWREPEVSAWPNAPIVLQDRGFEIPQPQGPIGIRNHHYGLYVLSRGQGSGLEVTAANQEGETLLLLPWVDREAREVLRVDLARQDPEAFFAIPSAGLVFRLNRLESSVDVQAYSSLSGELQAETHLQQEADSAILEVSNVTVEFTHLTLPRYEVIYHPTAPMEILGMVLFAVGTIMLIAKHDIHGDPDSTTDLNADSPEDDEEA